MLRLVLVSQGTVVVWTKDHVHLRLVVVCFFDSFSMCEKSNLQGLTDCYLSLKDSVSVVHGEKRKRGEREERREKDRREENELRTKGQREREKRKMEIKEKTVAGPLWGINVELQLQSCLRRRINIELQIPSGPLQEFKM